jgi:hypothetical protein
MATRVAHVELISGVAAGIVGPLTWLIWLFVPWQKVYAAGPPYIGTQIIYTSPVDVVHGLDNFTRDQPIYSLLILAFMLVTAAVAYGAYRHVRRSVAEGRLVVWGGTILSLLLLSALHIEVPVDLGARVGVQAQSLALALGLCVVLAIIASVAAIGVEDVLRQASR